MKRQNGNSSPELSRGRLVPSSHKGSKFRYAIVRKFSRGDERIREDIPVPDSFQEQHPLAFTKPGFCYAFLSAASCCFLLVEISYPISWPKYLNDQYPSEKSNRKALNRHWSNQKANPALKTKTGNKSILQMDKIQ